MSRQSYEFVARYTGHHLKFYITDSNIVIAGFCHGSGGLVTGDYDSKIQYIGHHATLNQLWDLRRLGYHEIATKAHQIRKEEIADGTRGFETPRSD